MAKKKKKTSIDDLDVKLAQGWVAFSDKIEHLVDTADVVSVDLSFESSLDEHTHYVFNSDDVLFITSVFISTDGSIRFSTPHAATKQKSFDLKEAELVAYEKDGTKEPFNQVATRAFEEAFASLDTELTPDTLQAMIRKEDGIRLLLNDAKRELANYYLKKERENKYAKLPYFGLF